MMRVLLVTLGSFGDLLPFLAVAKGLQERGHQVAIGTNSEYENHVRRRGYDFYAISNSSTHAPAVDDARFWSLDDAWALVWHHILAPAIKPTYEWILRQPQHTNCVVVASWMALGARLANEKLKVPLCTVYLAPYPLEKRPPDSPVASAGALLDDQLVQPKLNEARAELGLAPLQEGCNSWLHSADLQLGLYPDWFEHRATHAQSKLTTVGFPLFSGAVMPTPYPALREFLSLDVPYIVFTFGTGMRHAQRLFEESIRACAILNARAILLTPHRSQIPGKLPVSALHLDYVPLNIVLRRAAVIVHHGGIGTCAEGIKAAVPQVVVPMAFDQFSNAAHIEELGLGRTIPLTQYNPTIVSEVLQEVGTSENLKRRCTSYARQLNEVAAIKLACDAIESLGRKF